MSHVVNLELLILDLEALGVAAKACGLELIRNQKHYKWWGHSVGDYPIPTGFTAEELGTCEHALSVVGNDQAYEIGVVKRRDGKPGYQLLYDYFSGGKGLVEKIGGNEAPKLKQRYQVEIFRREMAKKGMRVSERIVNGKLQVEATR